MLLLALPTRTCQHVCTQLLAIIKPLSRGVGASDEDKEEVEVGLSRDRNSWHQGRVPMWAEYPPGSTPYIHHLHARRWQHGRWRSSIPLRRCVRWCFSTLRAGLWGLWSPA